MIEIVQILDTTDLYHKIQTIQLLGEGWGRVGGYMYLFRDRYFIFTETKIRKCFVFMNKHRQFSI